MLRNFRSKTLVLALLASGAPLLRAQIGSIKIFTNPPGAWFYVDEQQYVSAVTLLWPAGSKHSIRVPPLQTGVRDKTQYVFNNAITNLGAPTQLDAISADPSLTYLELNFSLNYAVMLRYFPCRVGDTLCLSNSPGRVLVNGEPFLSDADRYYTAGSQVTLEAYPGDGYIFTGWAGITATPVGSAFLTNFTLNQPQTVGPMFTTARPIQISFGTSPPGLQVLIDRTPVADGASYQWGWGTDHQVGAIPVQRDHYGHIMIFDSWSDGGPINHTYHVQGAASSPLSLTANFVPGAAVSFLTDPPLLKLSVDGRTNWENYDFYWAQGASHAVSAPLTQLGPGGVKYKFVSWSNGGPASQTVTVANAPDDVRITAVYAPVAQLTLTSVPAGLTLNLDGGDCTTPCSVEREVGVSLNVSAPVTISPSDGARLAFQGWIDGASPSRTITTVAHPQVLTANYQWQYRLATNANPVDGVVWRIDPASPDGFYNAQSGVTVSADVQPGYRFLGWGGDATGVTRPVGISMVAPKLVTAMLDPIPFVDQGGLKNAAGDTPESIVAPGSVISIVGLNLAPWAEQGPAAPLKQALAGVVVQSNSMLVPLFMVTPQQINAQLPFEVPEGPQSLTVQWGGKPAAKVDFTVARNAPGLFANPINDTPYALASHADGSPVTPDQPAVKGETITIFGTGFSPYLGPALDGFPLPQSDAFMLADPVDVVVADAVVQPVYAGTADQRVGVQAVQIVITDDLPSGTNAQLKVRINGHESNTVILPLQ